MRSAIALISCAAVLALVDFSIVGKERQLESGKVAYLELAPMDPRSLMQGDYMALRFRIAQDLDGHTADRRMPLHLDERRVATVDKSSSAPPLRMRYRMRNGQVWLGTNAYFFEESSAERFADA